MSLQRRLLVYLALCAPLVWAAALFVSVDRARHEVNELFDAELIRLARQVEAIVPDDARPQAAPPEPPPPGTIGDADLSDLAIAVWDRQQRLLVTNHEGAGLPWRAGTTGFVNERIDGEPWRVYYMPMPDGSRVVATGQKTYERDELVFDLTSSQIGPWLIVLPALLLAMAWAVRRALAPVHELSGELRRRRADDLAPLPEQQAPSELRPLVHAMNGLFSRIGELLERERRFTADAAHELRTPLAVLRAQWDVVRRSGSSDRAMAEAKFEAGLERMDRLVTQLLALSRAEATAPSLLTEEVDWAPIVEQVMTDCLPLARRRRIELACDWPAGGRPAFPLLGASDLLTVLLRNLVDNATRYSPQGSTVTVRLETNGIDVDNDGQAPATVLDAPGGRFSRPAGQAEPGSGLGLSIVQRIAALHGLELRFGAGDDGCGVRAGLRYARPAVSGS